MLDRSFPETVLVLGNLGLQLSKTSLLNTHSCFVPASQVHQVFIHEAIECWSVNFYLAVIVDRGLDGGKPEMEVRQIFGVSHYLWVGVLGKAKG